MRWFPCNQDDSETGMRVFCLPYAGAGALVYRSWQNSDVVPPGMAVWPIQLPGREDRIREQPYRSMHALVEALTDVMEGVLDVPFALFGHSMGALIALELARSLRRRSLPGPAHVIVSGAGAPHLPRVGPSLQDLLDDDALIARLLELNGTRPEVFASRELRELVLPLVRADFSVCETYQCTNEAPLDCAITAYGGAQDASVSIAALAAWKVHSRGAFHMHVLPGDHFFIGKQWPLMRVQLAELFRRMFENYAPPIPWKQVAVP